MRKITNNANLPPPMYNALAADTYVGGGDISVTRLIAPPRYVALTKVHEDEIEEDASDRVWSLLGQSTHRVLELSAADRMHVETRLYMPFEGIELEDGPMKWTVSGQPDLYEQDVFTITDYKVTSVWSVIFGKSEWEQQVNMQAMLHRYKGDRVERGQIVAILRDWQKSKARVQKDYPPIAIKTIGIPLWTQKDAVDYTRERVKIHQQAQLDYLASGKDVTALPLCTPDERWYRGQKFAVKRMATRTGKVNKKADRLFDTEDEAVKYMAANQGSIPTGTSYMPVEERPGTNKRCLEYCAVAKFCDFGRKVLEEQARATLSFAGGDDTEE